MKKLLFSLIALLFIIAGCSDNNINLVRFDQSDLKAQMSDYEFQPELPTKLPFEVEDVQFSPPPEEIQQVESFHFDFYGADEAFYLHTVKGKEVSSTLEDEYKEVEIGDHQGSILHQEEGNATLAWTENGVDYRLKYFSNETDESVIQQEMIETAASFE
ncbi:hypothetical protein [Halobacillus yeomjeoni]|uniref:DUF4367 domain-containing protein n=1 Tax=Halobacillus yeomjeoni TaxID=311194 RepID=A0A931HVX1_9BACI|nr:hypothetical protein [Halobacillus yeomjeoni]MBH0230464.1 hypothetical protein [Halobacillus yeomjeoni]